MDERFRGKGLWIGLGALGIIVLCVMLCGLASISMVSMRAGAPHGVVPYAPVPEGEGSAAPPAVYHYGPAGMWGYGFHTLVVLFKILTFGLLLLVLLGLVRRLWWGHGHWHWRPAYPGQPPQGRAWEGHPHPMWHPWACPRSGESTPPEAEAADEHGETGTYTGPEE